MAIAIREVTEWHGTGEKKITDNYHNLTGSKGSLGSTAWCASFANYCLKETGYDYSGVLQSLLNFQFMIKLSLSR